MRNIRLIDTELQKTLTCIRERLAELFPNAGLVRTCTSLCNVAGESKKVVSWIRKPNYYIRISSYLIILFLAIPIIQAFRSLHLQTQGLNVADFFQMIDAGFNTIILLGATIIALTSYEIKQKRKRIIKAINQLRCIAHIIDAHQISKDPDTMRDTDTKVSYDGYLLVRYLDSCSDMLSLISKIGFLYAQDFDDPEALEASNDLEVLTTGIAQKIWQKIRIIQTNVKEVK